MAHLRGDLGRFVASINVSFGAMVSSWNPPKWPPLWGWRLPKIWWMAWERGMIPSIWHYIWPQHDIKWVDVTRVPICSHIKAIFQGTVWSQEGFKGIYLDILDQSFAGQGNNQLKGPFSMQIMAKNEKGIIVLYWLTKVWLFVTCTKHQYLYQYTVKCVCVCVVCVLW